MIQVFENFLSSSELSEFKKQAKQFSGKFSCFHTQNVVEYIDGVKSRQHILHKNHVPDIFNKIINASSVDYEYIEWWKNTSNKGIHKHADNDAGYANMTGLIAFPMNTYVYYTDIKIQSGGQLTLYKKNSEEILKVIQPKQNDLIVFDSDINHSVAKFIGTRESYVINPWKNRPVQFCEFSWKG